MKAERLIAGVDWADLFHLAPVSLWIEDFSAVRKLLLSWHEHGVRDLRAYLSANPQRVAACISLIRVLMVNRRTLDMFEAESVEHLIDNLPSVFRGEMLSKHADEVVHLWEGRTRFSSQTVNYTLRGARLDVLFSVKVLPGHEENWDRVLLSLEDVTERAAAQQALQQSENYSRLLFERSPVALRVENYSGIKRLFDELRRAQVQDLRAFVERRPGFVTQCLREISVLRVNHRALDLFGDSDHPSTGLGPLCDDAIASRQAYFLDHLVDLWNGVVSQQREVVERASDGRAVHLFMQFSILSGHERDWAQVLMSLTDITALKQAEARLEYLATHDALTGLRNRGFFVSEFERLQQQGRWPIAVVVADLNGLKRINDDHGHAAGDEVIRQAGDALKRSAGSSACVARIGGDEFALLLPSTDEGGADSVLRRIADCAAMDPQPGQPSLVSFSLGMACAGREDKLALALHLADQRMYASKRDYYSAAARERRARSGQPS